MSFQVWGGIFLMSTVFLGSPETNKAAIKPMKCKFYQTLKRKVFEIIQPAEKGRLASKVFDLFIMALILFSIVSVFVATFDISARAVSILLKIEWWSLLIFSMEYLLRLWTADLLYPESTPLRARLRYAFSWMAVIDLLAIMPLFLPMFIPVNLVGIRAFRLIRLLRIFKMNRYTNALVSIAEVFRKKAQEIIVSIFFVLILLIIASLLIYYVEHDAQPDKFTNAFSGLWWAVATLTTVGYGDIYPITVFGRILATVMAVMGIGMVAVPTSILSAGFIEVLDKKNHEGEHGMSEPQKYYPYCGKWIDSSNDIDYRWRKKRQVEQLKWYNAQRIKKNLSENDNELMRDTIASMIESDFNIWMAVFSDDDDMKQRIFAKFEGRAPENS